MLTTSALVCHLHSTFGYFAYAAGVNSYDLSRQMEREYQGTSYDGSDDKAVV